MKLKIVLFLLCSFKIACSFVRQRLELTEEDKQVLLSKDFRALQSLIPLDNESTMNCNQAAVHEAMLYRRRPNYSCSEEQIAHLKLFVWLVTYGQYNESEEYEIEPIRHAEQWQKSVSPHARSISPSALQKLKKPLTDFQEQVDRVIKYQPDLFVNLVLFKRIDQQDLSREQKMFYVSQIAQYKKNNQAIKKKDPIETIRTCRNLGLPLTQEEYNSEW